MEHFDSKGEFFKVKQLIGVTSFPGCVTDHVTHRRDYARGGRAVDSSAEREEESALTTAAQVVPQPAGRAHPEKQIRKHFS